MSLVASCQNELVRAGPVVTAFGQAALTTTPILVAIAGGLLDVSRRNVVVTGSVHRDARRLLYLLVSVAAAWILADGAKAAGLAERMCLGRLLIFVAVFQAVVALSALTLLVYAVRRLSMLVEVSDG